MKSWTIGILVAVLFGMLCPIWAQLPVTDISPDAPYGSMYGGANPSGLIVTLAVDPVTNFIYAAGDLSGVWVSTDEGQSWSQRGNGLRSGIAVRGGCCDPVSAVAAYSDHVLYAVQDDDGRVAGSKGGLWVSLSAGFLWKHVDLPNCTNPQLSHVVFANGTPIALGAKSGCRLWTSSDPNLGVWTPLPEPPWPALRNSQYLATVSGSKTVYACANSLGGYANVYRNSDLAHGANWDPPIHLPGVLCVGLAGVPAEPTVGSSSRVAVLTNAITKNSQANVRDVLILDFNNRNKQTSLGFSNIPYQTGSGTTGLWIAGWASNPANYDVFVADECKFYYLSQPLGQAWTQLDGSLPTKSGYCGGGSDLHADTHSMAFLGAYDPGAGTCTAFAATDGGVYADINPSDCSLKGAADGWLVASAGLHVTAVNGLTGVSNPYWTATTCQGAPYSYSACPSLYFGSADNDSWDSLGGGFTPSFAWQYGNFNLGDSDVTWIDPVWPSVAMSIRNGNEVLYGAVSYPPPDAAVTPDPPFQNLGNYHDNYIWEGFTSPVYQGVRQVMTVPADNPLGPVWDYVAIASAARVGDLCGGIPCDPDSLIRLYSSGTPQPYPGTWSALLKGPFFFGPEQIGAVAVSGGHSHLTAYVMTANDIDSNAYNGWPSLGPGLIWRGDTDSNTGYITNWKPAFGSGSKKLGKAFNLFVNPYSKDELYATATDGSGTSIKVSRDGGKTWATDAGLTKIATNYNEFVMGCGGPAGGTLKFQSIFQYACSLTGIYFDPIAYNIRVATLYPGGVALSRDFGLHWIPLDVTNNRISTAKGPIDLPQSVFYDPAPDWTLGLPSAYIALAGHGVIRVDGLSPDLSAGEALCGTCANKATSQSRVEVVVPTLDRRAQLQLDGDGKWRANVLFDAAGINSLQYYFLIDGQPTLIFVHHITPEEHQSGVMVLSD